jgi:hypothetical protein
VGVAPSLIVCVTLLLLALPSIGRACSVPVFRYALEHWTPQQYEVAVLHRGPRTDAVTKAVRVLEEAPANLTAVRVEAGALPADLAPLWEMSDPQKSSPWLVLRRGSGEEKTLVWSGPLTEGNVQAVVGSPARQEIVHRLTRGDSAVFVLLTCGRPAEDTTTLRLLETQLPRLQQELHLPEHAAEDAALRSPTPLQLRFSVLPVERTAAAEGPFVRMLLQVDDLEKSSGPIVFPIFGRGRALAGLPGADLDADVLRRTTAFLCGACSCEVKDRNPGVDLLLSADWEALLGLAGEEKRPPPPAAPVAASAGSPPTHGRPAWLYAAIVAAGLLVIVTGARVFAGRRPSPPQ